MNASEVNNRYLDTMLKADPVKNKVLHRVRELWWPHFIKSFELDPQSSMNQLDLSMNISRTELKNLAEEFAKEKIEDGDLDLIRQRVNQFIKSNTGKMFERFIGLAIAHYLKENNSKYAIWPFRKDLNHVCNYLKKEQFEINCQLGESIYKTAIDSDLIIFSPENRKSNFYMLSIKSTLKDRFHNVPFWNLLRVCAVHNIHNLSASDLDILSRVKYVAACTDLAKEQPDFSNHQGPRNLLCLDAAILDGAYVTSSSAVGLGNDDNHFGKNRSQAFYPLSKFIEMLCAT
jgi:hypothetical protein